MKKILLLGLLLSPFFGCAPQADKNQTSVDDIMADISGENSNGDGSLPKALGGQGIVATPKVMPELKVPAIPLNNNQAWIVDECFTFTVSKMVRETRNFSISGSTNGEALKEKLSLELKGLENCNASEQTAAHLNDYFKPLKNYVKAMHQGTHVKESNEVVKYLEAYEGLFTMEDN